MERVLRHVTVSKSYSVFKWVWRVWAEGIIVAEFDQKEEAEEYAKKLRNGE
jgi:hypothetical protein